MLGILSPDSPPEISPSWRPWIQNAPVKYAFLRAVVVCLSPQHQCQHRNAAVRNANSQAHLSPTEWEFWGWVPSKLVFNRPPR